MILKPFTDQARLRTRPIINELDFTLALAAGTVVWRADGHKSVWATRAAFHSQREYEGTISLLRMKGITEIIVKVLSE